MAGQAPPTPIAVAWFTLIRWVTVTALVLAVWNPSGLSYWAWVRETAAPTPTLVVAGVALAALHVVAARIAFVALGYAGIGFALAAGGSVLVAAQQLGLVELERLQFEPLFWLSIWSTILWVGSLWAKLQKSISGQRGVLKSPP